MQKDVEGQKHAKMHSIAEKERAKIICMRQAQLTTTNHTSCGLCSQRIPEPSVLLVLILLNFLNNLSYACSKLIKSLIKQ